MIGSPSPARWRCGGGRSKSPDGAAVASSGARSSRLSAGVASAARFHAQSRPSADAVTKACAFAVPALSMHVTASVWPPPRPAAAERCTGAACARVSHSTTCPEWVPPRRRCADPPQNDAHITGESAVNANSARVGASSVHSSTGGGGGGGGGGARRGGRTAAGGGPGGAASEWSCETYAPRSSSAWQETSARPPARVAKTRSPSASGTPAAAAPRRRRHRRCRRRRAAAAARRAPTRAAGGRRRARARRGSRCAAEGAQLVRGEHPAARLGVNSGGGSLGAAAGAAAGAARQVGCR